MEPKERSPRAPRSTVRPDPPQASIGRRRFLIGATVTVGAAGVVAGAQVARAGGPVEDPESLARRHADDPAMLIDLARCVGCGRCVRACKVEGGLGWRADQPALGPDAELASTNRSIVRARTVETEVETPLGARRRLAVRYAKVQCMHCLEPACASACFMRALRKSDAGPVVYDADRCIGCRYCLVACPFGIPTFDWDATFGRVEKCDLCAGRLARGDPPACAEACPQGAIAFGRRADLLVEAWRRIGEDARYVHHVYGEHEAGGTSVLYVSDVPFEALGFRTSLPAEPLPGSTWAVTRMIPSTAVGVLTGLTLLYLRRRRYLERERAEREEAGP